MVIGTKAAIAAVSFVLVGAGGAAMILGGNELWQALQGRPKSEVKVEAASPAMAGTRTETKVASAEPFAALPPASAPSNDVATAFGQAKENATSALADIPAPPAPRAAEDSGPR